MDISEASRCFSTFSLNMIVGVGARLGPGRDGRALGGAPYPSNWVS
jgi:hypothetical protein